MLVYEIDPRRTRFGEVLQVDADVLLAALRSSCATGCATYANGICGSERGILRQAIKKAFPPGGE